MEIGPFLLFMIAASVSFVSTMLAIVLYRRLGWIDTPDSSLAMTTHERPVPRGGGIPIFLSVLLAAFLALPLDQHLVGILVGAVLLAIVGVLDDRYNLNPYLRLVLQIGAALSVVISGIGIAYINIPFLGTVPLDQPRLSFALFGETREIWVLSDLFALLWIVSLMNAVNWSKGLDGQLPGFVAIAALTIGILSGRFSADITQWSVLMLALITAGAYAGFLPWNFYPQRIMPGFGGGTLGGYLLAVLSILSTTKVGTLLVVLGVPLVDAVYTIGRRVISRRSPVWGDRGHLHHRLLDSFGWSRRRIALFYWGITAALGIAALQLNSQQKFYTIITVGLVLGGLLLWSAHFGLSLKPRGPSDG